MTGRFSQHEQLPQREAFFSRVLQQHSRLLYRVAYSVLRNAQDAEDAVADTLLKLLRTGAWQNISQERAFLVRAVWRSALDRFAARPPAGSDEDGLLLLQDEHPDPEEQFARAEEHETLHALIDCLPEELRETLLLSAVQELNSREIGETLNLPEGTVRTRLMRARQQLRTQYEGLQAKNSGRETAARGSTR